MSFLNYTISQASVEEIDYHLSECNTLFKPHLNSYVNIKDYSKKIRKYATTFEAWNCNKLVGLVACYLNDKESKNGHITNVSVIVSEQRKGIAETLISNTINESLNNGFETITLEVEEDNASAIKLYQKLNFTISQKIGNKYSMINRLDENKKVMVSICSITYNQANYIRKAFDGFIMQKTDFSFEILIHDDASTDGTEEIIREYEAKYPEIIKPIYEKENQWVKGRRGSVVFNFPRAKGKYIALCEGDDYWTDPLKLQKQIDFLEANPNYTLSCHRYKIFNESSQTETLDYGHKLFKAETTSIDVCL